MEHIYIDSTFFILCSELIWSLITPEKTAPQQVLPGQIVIDSFLGLNKSLIDTLESFIDQGQPNGLHVTILIVAHLTINAKEGTVIFHRQVAVLGEDIVAEVVGTTLVKWHGIEPCTICFRLIRSEVLGILSRLLVDLSGELDVFWLLVFSNMRLYLSTISARFLWNSPSNKNVKMRVIRLNKCCKQH